MESIWKAYLKHIESIIESAFLRTPGNTVPDFLLSNIYYPLYPE
jgi:hypothetical protein